MAGIQPTGQKWFTGQGYTTGAEEPKPPASRCWRCLTGIRDALVGLLARIRNCFCCCFGRTTRETPRREPQPPNPPIMPTAPQPPTPNPAPIPSEGTNPSASASVSAASASSAAPAAPSIDEDMEEAEEIDGDISLPVGLFFEKVEDMDDDDLYPMIAEQGLALFSCLSIKEKYLMLKKLVNQYDPPSKFFLAYLGKINDRPLEGNRCIQPELAQDAIFKCVVNAFIKERSENALKQGKEANDEFNRTLIENWLKKIDKDVSADSIDSAVKAAFQDTHIRVLMTEKATVSREGDFALLIVQGALSGGKFFEDVFKEVCALVDFNKFVRDCWQLSSIESLMVIAGSGRRQIINPEWIIKLINALPVATKRKIAERIPNEEREHFLKNTEDDCDFFPNLTMEAIQSKIYPIFKNDKEQLK